jgi:hypothetical protein
MVSRAILLVASAVLTVVILMVALIVWVAHEANAPHPDRSGTVLEKVVDPGGTTFMPFIAGKLIGVIPTIQPADYGLVVRRSDGSRRTAWVRRRVYEQCRVGDWYDSPRRMCRP